MEEERIKANLEDFGKTEGLVVLPYISDANQRVLIGIYVNDLFSKDNDNVNYNYIGAENSLLLALLELCTNLNLIDDDGKPLFTLNDVFYNIKQVNEIFSRIRNYEHFMDRLYATVKFIKEERRLEKSLGSAIDGLYSKLLGLIEAFEDLDPEKVSAMVAEINKSEILKESISLFKQGKASTDEKPSE